MAKFKVCVSDARHASYEIEKKAIEAIGGNLFLCNCKTEEDIIHECGDADAIFLDMAPMSAAAIAGLKKCKCINRYGVGYDNVDVEAASKAGIQVTYVPDYCAEDVSDHALALMLSCLRQVALRDRLIRQGRWNIQQTSFRLQGKVLGVLGFGRIAKALIRKCSGFGFSKVMVYDPYVPEKACKKAGVEKKSLKEVFSQSDFVSLHMPITPETTHIVNEESLEWMKPTSILINTSRGKLVDDHALATALRENQILHAGLDTHNVEPITVQCPYRDLDNVTLTDHTAYSTVEGVIELKTKSAQNIADVLTGKKPNYQVNKL